MLYPIFDAFADTGMDVRDMVPVPWAYRQFGTMMDKQISVSIMPKNEWLYCAGLKKRPVIDHSWYLY